MCCSSLISNRWNIENHPNGFVRIKLNLGLSVFKRKFEPGNIEVPHAGCYLLILVRTLMQQSSLVSFYSSVVVLPSNKLSLRIAISRGTPTRKDTITTMESSMYELIAAPVKTK